MFSSWFAPAPRLYLRLEHQVIAILPNQTVLQTALLQGVHIPHGCKVGGCGMCKCRLISGKVEQIIEKNAGLTASELNCGIIFACCSIAKSDLQIEIIKNTEVKSATSQQKLQQF